MEGDKKENKTEEEESLRITMVQDKARYGNEENYATERKTEELLRTLLVEISEHNQAPTAITTRK